LTLGTSGADLSSTVATGTTTPVITLNVPTASAANRGALSSADWTTFNSKVPSTRSLTINGTTQDLSADRTFTIATGLTVGTTAIASGTVGRILFEGTGNVLQESANLFWNNTTNRLGVGTSAPTLARLQVKSTDAYATTPFAIAVSSPNEGAYIGGFFNDTKSTTIPVATYFGWNNGDFNMGTLLGKFFLGAGGDLSNGSTTRMTIHNATGNVGIGTTTDAGYKFDVNGTARVQGNTTVTGFLSLNSFLTLTPAINGNVIQGTQTIEYRSGGSSLSRNYHWFTNANAFTSTVEEMYHVLMTATFAPTSGTAGYTQLTLYPAINQTGGANGITRGLLIQPTLTAAANWRAIEISSGGVYVNTTSVAASSILQADSTTQGFLPPRMTTTQKNAIATPAAGLVVYDTTLGKLCVRGAAAWETITSV
jgi:hypothetical protein